MPRLAGGPSVFRRRRLSRVENDLCITFSERISDELDFLMIPPQVGTWTVQEKEPLLRKLQG